MARARSPWHVPRDPKRVRYAFFLSHVTEDAEDVRALKAEISGLSGAGGQRELSSYLDVQNWEIGNDPGDVIREYLLRSEYMVAWITPAYLEAGRRGWIWYEFAYAELIESGLNAAVSGRKVNYILPVFRGVPVQDIERSPLANYWLRKPFHPGLDCDVPKIAHFLVDFYHQEARKRGESSPGP